MKKSIFVALSLFISTFLAITTPVQAQMENMTELENNDRGIAEESAGHGESIQDVLAKILKKQQAATVQELICDKVNNSDFERLGDAVMEQQHPGDAHEAMDEMMGGEGSESLRLMHINMGSNYLGCRGNDGVGMMGGGMMGYGDNSTSSNFSIKGFPMMGFNSGVMNGYSAFTVIFWIALIAFLLSGVYFFIKQANKK